jgi:hypothetical protein
MSFHSPKVWPWPAVQGLALELLQERVRVGLADTIHATNMYVDSCKLEIGDLARGASDHEPQDRADHRADLTEFLHDEITQVTQHIATDRLCIEVLLCKGVLPVLEPFPGLRSPIRWTLERVTNLKQHARNEVFLSSYMSLRHKC